MTVLETTGFHTAAALAAFAAAMGVAIAAGRGETRPGHVIACVGLLGVSLHYVVRAGSDVLVPGLHIGVFLLLSSIVIVVLYSRPGSALHALLYDEDARPPFRVEPPERDASGRDEPDPPA